MRGGNANDFMLAAKNNNRSHSIPSKAVQILTSCVHFTTKSAASGIAIEMSCHCLSFHYKYLQYCILKQLFKQC